VARSPRWCAIAGAPAWWWGPAFEVLGLNDPLPAKWCVRLGLPGGAAYADGAEVFLKSFAGQTSLPWPDDFPRRPQRPDPN